MNISLNQRFLGGNVNAELTLSNLENATGVDTSKFV